MQVRFTPTVEHCSMATLIGLCIRVKLLRALPPRFKVRTSALVVILVADARYAVGMALHQDKCSSLAPLPHSTRRPTSC